MGRGTTAVQRWSHVSLPPTVVVNSGHGIHACWKLADPVSLRDPKDRAAWELVVKSFATELGGDATHDATRLLRLPGTMNVKNLRNGVSPVPCTLVSVDECRVYRRATFEQFLAPEPTSVSGGRSRIDHSRVGEHVQLSTASMGRGRDHRRIQGVLRYLDRDVSDRSRRDLGALILLSQAGLSKAEIHSLVMRKSQFLEAGEAYFERTFDAALQYLKR